VDADICALSYELFIAYLIIVGPRTTYRLMQVNYFWYKPNKLYGMYIWRR